MTAAMLTILRGRVEMDPMRVPTTSLTARGADSFEQTLQQVIEEPRGNDSAKHRDSATAAPDAEPEVATEIALPPDEAESTATESVAEPAVADDGTIGRAATTNAEITEPAGRTESARPTTAVDEPASKPARRDLEPLLAAVVQRQDATTNVTSPAAGNQAISAVGGPRAAGTAVVRGAEQAPLRPTAPLPTPAVTAGYRSTNVASAQLLEQTRDYVFKQILLRLAGDRGEMRMRLEPPELGELDVRLIAEGGNKMSLAIAAERADVGQLLQRHLAELQQTLQDAGIEITGAEVQTRDEFARQSQQHDEQHHKGATSTSSVADETLTFRPARTIAAEGLDFWA